MSSASTRPSDSGGGGAAGDVVPLETKLQQGGSVEPPRVPGIEILSDTPVGEGGHGVVYRARERSTGRQVALKVLREGPGATPVGQERFRREGELMRSMSHAGIVEVIRAGSTKAGRPYLVMEWLEGGTLALELARVAADRAMLRRVFEEVCGATQALHDAGILHRDIKAGNVLLTGAHAGSSAKLSDFGLAIHRVRRPIDRFTSTGIGIGTLIYMSPEQAVGEEVDERTDVFALGVLLAEMLLGERLSSLAQLRFVRRRRGWLMARVVARATSPDRDRRWSSARDLARAFTFAHRAGARSVLLLAMGAVASCVAAVALLVPSLVSAGPDVGAAEEPAAESVSVGRTASIRFEPGRASPRGVQRPLELAHEVDSLAVWHATGLPDRASWASLLDPPEFPGSVTGLWVRMPSGPGGNARALASCADGSLVRWGPKVESVELPRLEEGEAVVDVEIDRTRTTLLTDRGTLHQWRADGSDQRVWPDTGLQLVESSDRLLFGLRDGEVVLRKHGSRKLQLFDVGGGDVVDVQVSGGFFHILHREGTLTRCDARSRRPDWTTTVLPGPYERLASHDGYAFLLDVEGVLWVWADEDAEPTRFAVGIDGLEDNHGVLRTGSGDVVEFRDGTGQVWRVEPRPGMLGRYVGTSRALFELTRARRDRQD